jgi:hypothetical protein
VNQTFIANPNFGLLTKILLSLYLVGEGEFANTLKGLNESANSTTKGSKAPNIGPRNLFG